MLRNLDTPVDVAAALFKSCRWVKNKGEAIFTASLCEGRPRLKTPKSDKRLHSVDDRVFEEISKVRGMKELIY
jgi:hypothetical protein